MEVKPKICETWGHTHSLDDEHMDENIKLKVDVLRKYGPKGIIIMLNKGGNTATKIFRDKEDFLKLKLLEIKDVDSFAIIKAIVNIEQKYKIKFKDSEIFSKYHLQRKQLTIEKIKPLIK